VTYAESFRHAINALITADLTAHETRAAVMSMIPKEFHVTHHQH
jgi:hypothetical protein